MCGGARGHLPCGRGDRSGTTLRQNHAVRAERGRGTDDRAEVLRIGHAVKRDEQRTGRDAGRFGIGRLHGARLLRGAVRQFGERGVLERLRLQHDALMVGRTRDAVHLQTIGLQQVQTVDARQTHDLTGAVVMLDARGDIQRGRRNAATQRLQHRIAADDQIIGLGRELRRATACGQTRIGHLATFGVLLRLVSLVIHAVFGLGSRTLAPQRVTMLSTRPLGRSFFQCHNFLLSQHPEKTTGAIATPSTRMETMEKKRAFFGLPFMFWGLWATLLILWMGRFVSSFLSMYLVSDMHVSAGVAGTIVSMYGFGGIFGCLYGGALSDRFGRPAMIIVGNLGSALMLVLLAFIGNPWVMAAALLVYGVISSVPTPAVAAYVSDVVPFRDQKRAYSLQTWAANFGFAIGPIIANQLVKISYSLMFYAEAAVLVFATILMIVFFKEVRLHAHDDATALAHDAEHGKASLPRRRPAASSEFSIWRSYRRACTDQALMSMVVLMFLYTLAYYQIVSGLPIAMTQIGLGTDEYSSLLTINGGILCLLQIPAIAVFQRMSNTRVLVLGMLVTAVGYAFQIGADSWATFAVATVLWTLGELGTFPIAATTVANIAPKDVRGTYQGLYNLVWSLSNAFSPLVGGWILNAFGSHVLWTCCTVMFVIVAIGFQITKGPRERAAARNLEAEEV